MLARSISSILLLWACGTSVAQMASVHAISPGYADQSIHTTVAWNPFISFPEFSSSVQCNEKGEFELEVPLKMPRVVQFETGIYQLYLYMEPGYHYEVLLPEYIEKKWNEQISPFYQPLSMPVKLVSRTSLSTGEQIDGSKDVNHAIERFDSLFIFANRTIIEHRKSGKPVNSDSIIQELEVEFSRDSSGFFSDYRRFRYGALKLNEGKTPLTRLSLDYLGPTVMEWHPGFIELFRVLFKDFIYYYAGSAEGQQFRNLVNRNQDYRAARKLVRDHPAVWSDTLAEMILLQEFSELFYRGEYHKEAILIMLDSMAHDPVTPEFGIYSAQLEEKLSSLVTGRPPPSFTLEDLNGNSLSLNDFEGKYTYLFFGTTDHYGCMMEYPFLQSYVDKHSDYLNVVTVMTSEDRNKLDDFMKRNGYTWTVLHYAGQPGVLEDYKVRAYPMAYLIDRNGLLLLSPATLPSDGFEQQLFRIMRARREI